MAWPKFLFKICVITKDAPVALIIQDIPKVWGAVSQELWAKTKGVFFIINHVITTLNLYINLRRLHICIMLCLTTHEHSMSLHLFITFEITFSSIL